MLLDRILSIVVSKKGPLIWFQAFYIICFLAYHLLVAIFNPLDQLGFEYGSINLLTRSLKSAILIAIQPVIIGIFCIQELSTRISLSVSFGWRGELFVTIHHLHCNVDLQDNNDITPISSTTLRNEQKKISIILTLMKLYEKYAGMFMYLNIFTIRLRDVHIIINNNIQLKVDDSVVRLSVNTKEKQIKLESTIQNLVIKCLDESDLVTSTSTAPLLQLNNSIIKLDISTIDFQPKNLMIECADLWICASDLNRSTVISILVQLSTYPRARTASGQKFQELMQKFLDIDAYSSEVYCRAMVEGRKLCMEDFEEDDLVYTDTVEFPTANLASSTSKCELKLSLHRFGMIMIANNSIYQSQVVCIRDCHMSLLQRTTTLPDSCTSIRELCTAAVTVAALESCVCPTTAVIDGSYCSLLSTTTPSSAGLTEETVSQPWVALQYTITHPDNIGDGSSGADVSQIPSRLVHEMNLTGTVAETELVLQVPALCTTLGMLTEVSAVLSVFTKQSTSKALSSMSRTPTTPPPLPAVQVNRSRRLGRLEISAPLLRVVLSYPQITPTTFTREATVMPTAVMDEGGGREISTEDGKLVFTLQQVLLFGTVKPDVSMPECSGEPPCTVETQQVFLTVETVTLSRCQSVLALQAQVCEMMRLENLSCTVLSTTSTHVLSHSTVSKAHLNGTVGWEHWGSTELDRCASKEKEFSCETTVQVRSVSITPTQSDLQALGLVTGLLSSSCRLYQPLQHWVLCPLTLIDTASTASMKCTKLYVVMLSATVELVWDDSLQEAVANTTSSNTNSTAAREEIITYRVLKNTQLSFTKLGVGEVYNKSTAHIYGDLVVNRICSASNRDDSVVELMRLSSREAQHSSDSTDNPCTGGFHINKRRMCVFTAKTLPNEYYSTMHSSYALCLRGSYSNIILPTVLMSLDYSHIQPLCWLNRSYQLGSQLGEQTCLQLLQGEVSQHSSTNTSLNTLKQPYSTMITTAPTTITAIHIQYIRLIMSYLHEPVLSLYAYRIDTHKLNFAEAVKQQIFIAHSVRLFEVTAKYAVHTCILADINETLPNRIEMHITSKPGQCALVEVQLEQIRIFYLQRSIMTLVSYLRDHFITPIYADMSTIEILKNCDLVTINRGNNILPTSGMTRIGIIITKSEFHLPLSSCSTDALVIIIDHTVIYRSFPVAATTALTTTYCQGPCILKKIWISESKSSRKLISLLFSDRDGVVVSSMGAGGSGVDGSSSTSAVSQLFNSMNSSSSSSNNNETTTATTSAVYSTPNTATPVLSWTLPTSATELLTPPGSIPLNTHPEFCLEFSIHNSRICSWCDANAVAESISLTGTYALIPITPGIDGEIRNRIVVDIQAEEINWLLAQGQYLSIINLIQQNFCELPELVPDIYELPVPKIVELTEYLYGKYGLDSTLPILSTVPIHIKRGKITAVESLPEYFELFCHPLPCAHHPYGIYGHSINTTAISAEVEFEDTIPVYSKHILHRDAVFARIAANNNSRSERYTDTRKSNKSRSRSTATVETGESIIGVLFEHLEIDFFRLHEGGGNGIEVSAGTLVIVGIEDHSSEDDDGVSVHSVSLEELSLDSIIFAPRTLPILNSGGNRSSSSYSATSNSNKASSSPRKKGSSTVPPNPATADSKQQSSIIHEDSTKTTGNTSSIAGTASETVIHIPHIKYSQQGTQNLRRCIVTIADSMAVANIAKVLHTVEYFLNPIHVNTHRNLYCIAEANKGPYDFKIALDMEVHVQNTVVCLTNISRRDGASALCFHVDLDYVQAWRGFLSSGPGKIGLNIDINVMNIYIAPMREINSHRIQSLVDPCVLVIGQDMMITPPEGSLQHNLSLLTPWMTLEKWAWKLNKSDKPATTRIVKFKVAPTSASNSETAFITPVSSNKVKSSTAAAANTTTKATATTATDNPHQAEDVEETSTSTGSTSEDEEEDSDSEETERTRKSRDAYYSGAETSLHSTVRVKISTKDIYFITTAVKQARVALNKRLIITTTQRDYFAESKNMLQDIQHLPQLTYYLVSTGLEVPSKKNKNNELLAEICDFEAVLRNNTYNLNILRMNVFDNCMLYTRSPEQLHMAAGTAFAMWAYNESTDMWEPLVEPINMRAIGATDESIHAAVLSRATTDSSSAQQGGAKIRVEVVTDPLELNAPQTALGHLIRKLSLADVVTTSSIHLPPYKVINELGVDVKFAIGMGDGIITEKEIESGKSLPVEVQQLSEALEAFKMRRNYTAGASAINESTAHKEYVMGVTFANFRDIYSSRVPLPIDKVGIHAYDMYHTGQRIPDPSGAAEVQFDRRRISMGSLGSHKVGIVAGIAQAAAAAAQIRARTRSPAVGKVNIDSNTDIASAVATAVVEPAAVEKLNLSDRTTSVDSFSGAVEQGMNAVVSTTRDAINGSMLAASDAMSGAANALLTTVSTPSSGSGSEGIALSPPRVPPVVPPPPGSPPGIPPTGSIPHNPLLSSPPSLNRRNSIASDAVGSTAQAPIKFMQEVPLTVMEMRIKADGVREILLRSILSFKNNTTRVFQLSVRLYGSSVETSLAPGKEWFVPVRYVNPKSSLYIRLDERANWFEALASLQGLIVQGYWGDPSRLRAHLSACPSETAEVHDGSNGWILLIKPEVKDLKAQLHGTTSKIYVPVRYPTKEVYFKTLKEGINALDVNANTGLNASSSTGVNAPTLKTSRAAKVQPMCIQLLAPLQLCNLIPQPLLYRLADSDGLITSEGVLLPGEMVDIHSIFKLFVSRIFISIRMLNYCWSKWTLVFSRTNPFSSTEQTTELTMASMSFMHQSRELSLPTVDISMVAREYLIRFSCSVLISNRTGLLLDLCDPATADNYLPHTSRTAAEAFLPVLTQHQHHHKKAHTRGGVNDTPIVSERPSFRYGNRVRTTSSSSAKSGSRRGRRGPLYEPAPDEADDVETGMSESEQDSGAFSLSEDSELESISSTSSAEGRDHTDGRLSEEKLDEEGMYTLEHPVDIDSPVYAAHNQAMLAGINTPDRPKGKADPARFSFPQSNPPGSGMQGSPGRMRLSTRRLPVLPSSPMSATSGYEDGMGTTNFATPGDGGSHVLSLSPPAHRLALNSVQRGGDRIINLSVHLPYDHLRQVDVVASGDWTLFDVFLRLKQRLATAAAHQSAANYVFFLWENGKLGARKVDNSLIIEAQQQYESGADLQNLAAKPVPGKGTEVTTMSGPISSTISATATATTTVRERPVSMFSRDRSASVAGTSVRRPAVDTEVPAPMQYEMLAECSLTPLALSTRVDTLVGTRLRLCHIAEWEIFKQTKSIKTEVVEKEGLFSSMFSRSKCTHHATLVPFQGDIPFKPHRMMGFNPSLSLRVSAGATDWSDPVDVIKGDFASSELCIVATSSSAAAGGTTSASGSRLSTQLSTPVSTASTSLLPAPVPPVYYEFGAFLERGRGFLQNVTTVTLVPKHVLISKLSYPIQLQQIYPSAECAPLTLLPGTLCSYHFPCKSKSKLLQIRRARVQPLETIGSTGMTIDVIDHTTASVVAAGEWLAEVDICKLGVLYAKLRDPVQIIKVQIDTVGASMVATFTEQSILWPPYRIDNMTEMEVRFRQIVATTAASGSNSASTAVPMKRASSAPVVSSSTGSADALSAETHAADSNDEGSVGASVHNSSTSNSIKEGTSRSVGDSVHTPPPTATTAATRGGAQVPWDHLDKQASAGYAWDLPFSGKKAIQLEVRQLTTTWVPCEVYLDDDDKPAPLIIKKAAPSLGNPFAEGFLLKQDATNSDLWTKVYCILRPDVLYIYPDDSRDYLKEVINLSASRAGEQGPQLACVSRYSDKKWTGTMSYISSVMGSSSSAHTKSKAVDINKTRSMLLKLAEALGLFSHITEHSFLQGSGDSQEDEERESDDISSSSSRSDHNMDEMKSIPGEVASSTVSVSPPAERAASLADSNRSNPSKDAESVTEVNWEEQLQHRETFTGVTAGAAALLTAPDDVVVAAALAATAVQEDPPPVRAHSVEEQSDHDVEECMRESTATLRRARRSSAPGSSLATLLATKVSVEELLEEAATVPIRIDEVIDALLLTKLADRPDRAKELCEWMLTEGLLKPKSASQPIDGRPEDLDLNMTEEEFLAASTTSAAEAEDSTAEISGNEEEGMRGSDDADSEERQDQFNLSDPLISRTAGGDQAIGKSSSLSPTTSTGASRMSFSRQINRALTSRSSVVGVDESIFSDQAGSRMSILGSRKKVSLLRLYEDVDLYFSPPPLNPEMQAMLELINREDEIWPQAAVSTSAGASSSLGMDNEVFGFTLMMDTVKHHFKCSSEMEFFGWIQACRQSIELLWVEHMLGRRSEKKAVSLEDYQATILLRLRADGSTKVLEVMQDDENIIKNVKNKSTRRLRGVGRRTTVSSAEAISKLSRVLRNSHLAPSLLNDSIENVKEFNREKELISVFFSVQSVALSVINAEPAEVMYLSLHGIEMTVERSIDLVKFSGTVQEIQLSNQLLDPEFAVALFPRQLRDGHVGRLMLPGLNPDRVSFPSLHLYIQQRYHQSISDVGSPAATDSFEEDSNLHYFEMFTVWISPMKLDLEEELIVKSIRYIRGLKDVIYNPIFGRGSEFKEDLLNLQQLGSKAWEGHADRRAVFELYMRLLDAGKLPYQVYSPSAKSSTGIYLSLLQLHPIDLVMSFRPSPNLAVTNSELAMISIISQLDSARLCLNALIAEHAFGSPAILGEVLVKHYKAAFWRQFHKFIGSSDIVEGSVGLVANLGSGVYDLFYEPIDGLLDENGSFLTGLSKGGISLASRTIGGTSAFTSQITGGLGKGVSLLTLDSQFQRNRAYRRFNKTSTVSEGLYVGTQELGQNIMEGVTGIVVSPYRGWESGGGVGFGMGIAKGILGVALKPAVGVFDLASRATEGLRNTAFNADQAMLEDRFGIHRKRIPRAFGRNGQIALYDPKAAAAQYVADSVTLFQPDPRLQVVHHLFIRRKLEKFVIPGIPAPPPVVPTTTTAAGMVVDTVSSPPKEAWGFPLGRSYLVLVDNARIVLAELSSPVTTTTTRSKNYKKKAVKARKFIWSCPASCIEQLYSDPNGDLILSIGNSALLTGSWNNPLPVVLDNQAQNYVIFQSLLEQTIGYKRARTQPMTPTDGLIQSDIRKRYSSGIRSYLQSPSNHTYRLCGHVLYEYTDNATKKAALKADSNTTNAPGGVVAGEGADTNKTVVDGTADTAAPATVKSEYFIDQMISRIFPTGPLPRTTTTGTSAKYSPKASSSTQDSLTEDMYLSFVYPLTDLYIAGPTPEDNGKAFSITLSRLDGQKMRVLRCEEEQEHFTEYLKNNLSLIFTRQEDAYKWKRAVEDQTLWNLEEDELIPTGPLTTEERRKQGRSLMTMTRGIEDTLPPLDDSILGMLVLPTSGCKAEQTEMIKIEIAKTLSSTRWR